MRSEHVESSNSERNTLSGHRSRLAEAGGGTIPLKPCDDNVFSVGKGTGNRLAAHGREADLEREPGQTAKTARLHDIRATA